MCLPAFLVFSGSNASPTNNIPTTMWQKAPYHIFVHPLISDTHKAFATPNKSTTYIYEWFVTTTEFKNMLSSLYAKN